MNEWLNRVLTGNTITNRQLVWAGGFISIWFLIDLIQFVGWCFGK